MARNDAPAKPPARVYFSGLLAPGQAAAALGVSESTALRMLRTGRLRGIKVGKLWRVRPADLADYLSGAADERTGPRTTLKPL